MVKIKNIGCGTKSGFNSRNIRRRIAFISSTISTIWKNKEKIPHAELKEKSCKRISKLQFKGIESINVVVL